MSLRQAAQQALEALEKNIHYTQTHLQDFDAAYNRHPSTENERGVITDDIEDAFAAMGALRAALAEPEQNPFGDDAERYARKLHEEREAYKALFAERAHGIGGQHE